MRMIEILIHFLKLIYSALLIFMPIRLCGNIHFEYL